MVLHCTHLHVMIGYFISPALKIGLIILLKRLIIIIIMYSTTHKTGQIMNFGEIITLFYDLVFDIGFADYFFCK